MRQPVFEILFESLVENLMDTMQKSVLIAHTLIALGIIALVLMQRGKGADAGAAFGAGASGTVFGSRGASSFFSRATAILATAFFVSSLTLAYMSSQRSTGPTSLLDGAEVVAAPASEAPEADAELPLSDMPSLDATEGEQDLSVPGSVPRSATGDDELPTLEEEVPADGEAP
jgi:preprotein translocase subunit SecG